MILRDAHGIGPQAWKRKITMEQARAIVRARALRRYRMLEGE